MDKATDKVFEYIDAIAAKLGVASEHVYSLLVKQQVVSGISKLLVAAFLIIVILVVVKYLLIAMINKRKNSTGWSSTFVSDEMFFTIFILVVIGAVTVLLILSGVKMTVNPEYYAIKEIVEMIR